MEREGRKPSSMRKKVCVGMVLVALLLVYELGVKVSPFWFDEKEVYAVSIGLHWNGGEGELYVTGREEVRDVVRTLRRIRGWRGRYSTDNLSGDSPSAMIAIYRSKDDAEGEVCYMIDDIAVPEADTYYKIRYEAEHKRLERLCKKYGEYREEEY